MARRLWPLVAVPLLALSACSSDSGSGPTGPEPSPPAPPAPPPPTPTSPNPDLDDDGMANEDDACPYDAEVFNKVFDLDGCPDTTLEFYQAVRDLAEQHWDAIFTASSSVYTPLGVFQEYTQPIATPCGTTLLNNALYCPSDLGVYYDIDFADSWLDEIGDAASAFTIAHEIGHHISFLRGWLNSGRISTKEGELQADCFAGATFAFADTAGIIEEPDRLEAARALILAADTNIPWFSPVSHGTPQQRLRAAVFGFKGGAGACESLEFFQLFPELAEERPSAPPGISFGGLTGLDSSNAASVRLTLTGSVVDRNGDGTAVTAARIFVSVDPAGLGLCPGPLENQEDNGVSPSDNAATEPVAVDVTDQVNASGGRYEVAFTAQNLSHLAGLSDVTYCFEVVADDGARRKNGVADGVEASAIVSKDFAWF
jgi:hypothetical protein